jgi:hypothetical protein
MSLFRRRVAAFGVAALALGMGAGATIATAAPSTPGTAPSYAPSWLALTTGKSSTVELATTGGTSATQTLKAGKACAFGSSGASLLTFSSDPASPGVGLANGEIGVRESGTSSGTSCSAVDSATGETLIVTLGSVGGLVAASASLDVDLKQSAQILATAKRDGDTVGRFELRSGTTIANPKPLPGGGTATRVMTCNNPADSGPDSGTNNNCRWEISAPSWTTIGEDGIVFDRLELKPLNGAFSLMGGADGYVDDPLDPLPGYFGSSGPSVFELVEGTVDCTAGTNTVVLRTSTTVPTSTWKRLGNLTETGTSTGPCAAYPYSATTGTDQDGRPFAEFNKPLNFEENAQATWETTFKYSGNVTDPIPGTKPGLPKVYMDLDGDTRGEFELLWCDPSWTDSAGVFVGPPNLAAVTAPHACLVSAVSGPKFGSSKSAVYAVYVYGDAKLRL